MATDAESSLISKLEGSDSRGVYVLVSNYLLPFADLKKPRRTRKPVKVNEDLTIIRSLAKKFLSFLNRGLSILPKRLPEVSKSGGEEDLVLELFEVYRLCLDCLDAVASQLAGKPYNVECQRLRMMRCLMACGKYGDAEVEGFGLLERLRLIDFGSKSREVRGKFLPEVDKGGGDEYFGKLVVEIVVALLHCAAMGQSEESRHFRRVLDLVEEVRPWLRVLDAVTYEKLHSILVSNLGKCASVLVEKTKLLDRDLLTTFCRVTLTEYMKSSMKDQVYKTARMLCSSLFTLQENKSSYILDILDCAAYECKVEEGNITEFVELVSYCVNKCQTANATFCVTFAAHLYKIAEHFQQVKTPINLILRLYATGLLLMDRISRSRSGDVASSGSAKFDCFLETLLDNENILQNLPDLLGQLRVNLHISNKMNCMSSVVEDKNLAGQIWTQLGSDQKASVTLLPSYLNALKFFCQPLTKSVNFERKQILVQKNGASAMTVLSIIQDVFHLLCDLILSFPSFTSEKNGNGFGENKKTVLNVAVAAFTLSIKTKFNFQKNKQLIKHIIASEWIQAGGLQYIIECLYSIGVVLCRNKQEKEASKVLNLCCKASWFYIKCNCGDLSEGAFTEFVIEAYTRSALLLGILYQVDNHKVRKKIIEILHDWSIANDMFKRLPAPMPVLKQWVKMACKDAKNVDEKDDSVTLYNLLSSSVELSKRNIGIILEQELTAYEEMSSTYPEFCHQMQMKITCILLEDVYVTPDSCFEKALTLVRKGKALRVCGIEGLKGCIQCFSEAITMMKEVSSETWINTDSLYHQLAVAYCLRALCTNEAEPKSKQIFEDFKAAVNIWLSYCEPDCSEAGECSALSDNKLILLYNAIDLLQLKGYMELYNDVYHLVIRLFKLKNVSTEKWLSLLWECRRMSHALCFSPVNEAFIMNTSDHFGELPNIGFWIHCLQGPGPQPLLIGFQQNFSFLFASSFRSSCNHGSSFQTDISVDAVQKAALEVISNVPNPRHSAFLAGYLYYDLCPRLISNGRVMEALSFAKEAYRLRANLFRGTFIYSGQQQAEENNEMRAFSKNLRHSFDKLGVKISVAREVLQFDSFSWNLKECYLSPWKILQCYLESTLQVGIILEMIGNVSEAENLLQWGKSISWSIELPLFMVAFSSNLGKLYGKKRCWDLAENELHNAGQILKDSSTSFCCSRCKLILEVTLYQYLGDMCQSRFDTSAGDATAENWYKSALDKLNLSEWKNSLTCPEDDRDESATDFKCGAGITFAGSAVNEAFANVTNSMREGPETKIGAKQSRKTKNAAEPLPKEQSLVLESKSRLTRSKYRSLQNQHISSSSKSEVVDSKSHEGNHICDWSDMLCQKESVLKNTSCTVPSVCAITCSCNIMRCWHCLPHEVMKSGLLNDFINLKWEFVRRQLSMKLLTQYVKCFAYPGQIDETCKILLRSISVLVSRNPFRHTFSCVPLVYFRDLVAKEIPGDEFAIERAEILHDISWFSLKSYHLKDMRSIFCNLSSIKFEDLASWLKLAFVLSREVPTLFQKVSRLLAVMYTVSASSEQFSLSSYSTALDENYWASYFHQASIGTHLTHQFLSNLRERCKDSYVTGFSCFKGGTSNLLRLVPETTLDLAEYVTKFLVGLPSTTVVSISLLGREYTSLLLELLLYPTCVRAWMLVSRMSCKIEPVIMLLPVDSILHGSDDDESNSGLGTLSECENLSKDWHCPWGFTVVDDVAPAFKTILEENYLSTVSPFEDTTLNRTLWWRRRKKLDDRLGKLLRNLEDLWFGSWKCLLLGEWLNCKNLDSVHKKLVRDLRSKYKLEVNEGLLKIILGGSKYACEGETGASQLCFKKGCYIAKVGYCDEVRHGILLNASDGFGTSSEVAFQLLNEALDALQVDGYVSREPIILVLDYEVQMLPWENLPILRNQEVYRMPSVSSISAVLDRGNSHQEQVGRKSSSFPLIDPLDAFYVLNPSGDLNDTQIEFENWFRVQNLEGKAGSKPTVEELASALKSHDLFIYFGHGSGEQYIARHEIQKLEKCAATLLMGCSSGSLTLHGSYAPQGTPLSYLLAGSPAIVANLWEVTDKDIDRFGKAMLDAWLKERLYLPVECMQCNLLSEELEALNLKGCKGKAKRKVSRKNLREGLESDSTENKCDHRRKIGSFMSQAREACTLPFLIGASPVCYGVPTGIWRKKNA